MAGGRREGEGLESHYYKDETSRPILAIEKVSRHARLKTQNKKVIISEAMLGWKWGPRWHGEIREKG